MSAELDGRPIYGTEAAPSSGSAPQVGRGVLSQADEE